MEELKKIMENLSIAGVSTETRIWSRAIHIAEVEYRKEEKYCDMTPES